MIVIIVVIGLFFVKVIIIIIVIIVAKKSVDYTSLNSIMNFNVPTLLCIDKPEDLRNKVLLYADDSKLIAVLDNGDSHVLTQDELNRLVDWADIWLMELNLDNYKVMHYGLANPCHPYTMRSTNGELHQLEQSLSERDQGVQKSINVKWNVQFQTVAFKANHRLGMLKN